MPDYGVYEVSRDISNISKFTALQIDNDVVFLDKTGVKTLSTVEAYGDIKVNEQVGLKINKFLQGKVDTAAKLFNVSPKKQLWIKYNNGKSIIVISTATGAVTFFEFNSPISDVIVSGDNAYVAKDNKIYILDALVAVEDGFDVKAVLKSKVFIPMNAYLIKRIYAKIETISACEGTILIDNLSVPIQTLSDNVYVLEVDDYVLECELYIAPTIADVIKDQRHCHRTKFFDVQFIVTKGSCSLRDLRIEIAEVN
jgi:hypothetical protein